MTVLTFLTVSPPQTVNPVNPVMSFFCLALSALSILFDSQSANSANSAMSFFMPLLPLLPCQISFFAERDVGCSCIFLVIGYILPTLSPAYTHPLPDLPKAVVLLLWGYCRPKVVA